MELASHSLPRFFIILAATVFAVVFISTAHAQVGIEWVRQFGTGTNQEDIAVALDTDGSIYVGGTTSGSFPGHTNAGDIDAFVRKYNASGTEIWTRQFGTANFDQVFGVSINTASIYVAGLTEGAFGTSTNAGDSDIFVRKYDSSGNVVWTSQIGSAGNDEVMAIDSDSTGVYLVGETGGALPGQTATGSADAFIIKLDTDGNTAWIRQFGTSAFDRGGAILIDGTDVYIGGITLGTLPGEVSSGGTDVFVRKYDTNGNEFWTAQFGTPNTDEIFGASADSSGIYVTGFTTGAFSGETNAGGADVFVRKYDTAGSILWTRQFGTSAFEQPFGILANGTGIYVVGLTTGTLPGQSSAGSDDIFVQKYNSSGDVVWTFQTGTSATDEAFGISMFSNEVYIAGGTFGTFPGETSLGDFDAFIIKLKQDDTDMDGIFDEIDTQPAVFSDDFDDGATTTGSITTRGGQNLTIQDATSSTDGVVAETDPSGSNPKAKIVACASTFNLSAGDKVVITCSSVVVEVAGGDGVEVEFVADDGTVVSTTLTLGSVVVFKTDTATFFVPEGKTATIIIEGTEIVLGSGESFKLPRNHGEYVSSQEDKKEAAKSRLGLPGQSKGHTQ